MHRSIVSERRYPIGSLPIKRFKLNRVSRSNRHNMKEVINMSAPVPNTVEAVNGSMKYLRVENGKLVADVVPYTANFTPAVDVASAIQRLNNDQAVVLESLNSTLRSQTLAAARATVSVPAGAISKSKLLTLAKGFRELPMFKNIEPRAAQTGKIADFILSNPAMAAMIAFDANEGEEVSGEE